jgi:LPS sulfotransferase NodH
LNPFDRADDIRKFGGDFRSYWRDLRHRRTSSNGVFSTKIFTLDLFEIAQGDASLLKNLTADYLIQIRRQNMLAQAISYHRAEQSSVWVSVNNSARPPYSYQYDGVLNALQSIRHQEASWDAIVGLTAAKSLTVFYEDFLFDEVGEIERLKSFCEVYEASLRDDRIGQVSIQRDGQSREAIAMFGRHLRERFPELWAELRDSQRIGCTP